MAVLLSELDSNLIEWWRLNGRSFPWRETNNPFSLFVAEVLLHRTRADNIKKIYMNLMKQFKSFKELSDSEESNLMNLLSPLGLKWRSLKLFQASRVISEYYGGRLPLNRTSLMRLPGVGDYIASAILTFLGLSDEPVIDTNTIRVISRLKGLKVHDATRKGKEIRTLYRLLENGSNPREFAYALIDMAALICVPKKPVCEICPVNLHCKTGRERLVPPSSEH